MNEFDIFFTQEEITDKCKTYNETLKVTITLGEYRNLVSENARLQCENYRLNDRLYETEEKLRELGK